MNDQWAHGDDSAQRYAALDVRIHRHEFRDSPIGQHAV